jgi:hypothetical protein
MASKGEPIMKKPLTPASTVGDQEPNPNPKPAEFLTPETRPMPEHLRHYTLDSMETAYRNGTVGESDLTSYLDAWNATPGRFTYAYWQSGAIRQRSRS